MKTTKVILSVIFIGLIFLTSCNKTNEINQENLVIDSLIGLKHNLAAETFLKSVKNKKMTNQEKMDYVKNYMLTNYNVDVSLIIESYKKNLTKDINLLPVFKNVNIDSLILNNLDLTTEFGYYMASFYNEVKKLGSDTTKMQVLADIYIDKALNNNELTTEEKELAINSLLVFKSSVRYWFDLYNEYISNQKAPSEDEYWKIPTADWAGGIIGTLGGPAGGVIGFLTSSITMVIGLW